MFRYFIKYSDDTPVALIRLSIDNATQTIIDQYWNAKLTQWKDGHYGMDVLIKGSTNTDETTEQEARRLFPNAPWE
ncbi:MAG: hypothetical protein ACK5GU_10305 [Chloroflexota bacterium]|jgi:hypothetical protein